MSVEPALDLGALVLLAAVVVAALHGERAPKNPLLRGIREIFHAMAGKTLLTPRNAWIWWRKRSTRVIRAGQP